MSSTTGWGTTSTACVGSRVRTCSASSSPRRRTGCGLTDAELKATAGLVLAAGFETTVNLLGNGIALLADDPAQLAILDERADLWPNAVDEVLRVDPPVLLTGRMTRSATEVEGVPMPRGAVMVGLLAGANRDPRVFPEPETFDVTRENARDHVSFSAGRHYCLGAALGPDGGRGRAAHAVRALPRPASRAGCRTSRHPHPARLRAAPGHAQPSRALTSAEV